MYKVSLSVYKEKSPGVHTAIEQPAFYRFDEEFSDVKRYLEHTFRDIACLYIEYVEHDEDIPL